MAGNGAPASNSRTTAAPFLSASAAAAILGLSPRTIRRAIARGDLRANKVNGVYRISPDSLNRYRERFEAPSGAGSLINATTQFRVPLTSFIGRSRELSEIRSLLDDPQTRILVLTGSGGVGKTRIAIQIALDEHDRHPNRVRFVSLAELNRPELVVTEIARSVDVPAAGPVTMEKLLQHLQNREMLLVLDNLEHLPNMPHVVSQLVAHCPELVILATSRVRLNVNGERIYSIHPLPYDHVQAPPGATPHGSVENPAALDLFAARAKAAIPDFEIDTHNRAIITEICACLDGLPLAIELATPWLRALSPKALLEELSQRLTLLIEGSIDLPPRHQTLRGTIAWSYALLGPSDRSLFRRLAVCEGGFSLGQADALANELPGASTSERSINLVYRLVEHNLVQPIRDATNQPRFILLETVREFALEQLAEHGETEAAQRAHAEWVLAFTKSRELIPLKHIDEEKLHQLATERGNVDTALEWSRRYAPDIFARIVAGVGWLWWIRRYRHEEIEWLEGARTLSEHLTVSEHARINVVLGFVLLVGGDLARAQACFDEGLATYTALGEQVGIAHMHMGLGVLATYRKRFDEAFKWFSDALEHAQGIAEPGQRATIVAAILRNRAVLVRDSGRLADAEADLLVAFELEQDTDSSLGMVHTLADLGDVSKDLGHTVRASDYYLKSLRLGRRLGETRVSYSTIEGIAQMIAGVHPVDATRLLGAADHWRTVAGVPLQVQSDIQARRNASELAAKAIGDANFANAWQEGASLSIDAVLDEAERQSQRIIEDAETNMTARTPQGPPLEPPSAITARELEVLSLVADGLTDRDIATRLYISTRTAENHVRNINRKLGTTSRRAAVARATFAGWLPTRR